MKTVTFTLEKSDSTTIDLEYVPFDNSHSKLWVQGIENSDNIQWGERVYNLNDREQALYNAIVICNQTINKINVTYNLTIPSVNVDNLQHDVNFAHTFFVDSNRDPLWSDLNWQLHGIEILERSKNKKLQGQIFLELKDKEHYDIPEESFRHFTASKTFGYCYANYPHVGRHILEMYNARDEEAHDEHVIPMHKISGSSYLWFGDTTNWIYNNIQMYKIKQWFLKNKINEVVGLEWGNPKLAIGWLPVAKLKNKLNINTLIGCEKVLNIKVN